MLDTARPICHNPLMKSMDVTASLVLTECRSVFGSDMWIETSTDVPFKTILNDIFKSNRVVRELVTAGAIKCNDMRVTLSDLPSCLPLGLFILSKGRERWIVDTQHA